MGGKKRVLLLILIMAAVATGVACVTLYALYSAAFEQQRERLIETAQSRARLLEVMLEHEQQESAYISDPIEHGDPFTSTLEQVRLSHDRFKGFGRTGEFTLARVEDDNIVFLLSHRHPELESPGLVPISSQLAEPMRRALSGQSGTVVGLDYRGARVLAAHEPVADNLGIVAKIDLEEIRAPFVAAGLLAVSVGVVFVALGTLLFLRIGGALARGLEQRTYELGKRVKELNCLYRISKLAARRDASLTEVLQGIVDLIPPAWQYPEIAAAQIVLHGHVYRTRRFGETTWRQASDIMVNGERAGHVEVRYLEQKPDCEEGPFSKEERALLNAIAERLGDYLKSRSTEEALQRERDNLTTILSSMKDGVYVVDENHDIQYANPALEAEFGPWAGRKCYDYLVERDSVCPWCRLAETLSGKTVQWEWNSTKTGKTYDLLGTPLKNPDRTFSRLEILRDVTERKRTERELKALNETLEQRVAERTRAAETRATQIRKLATELTQTEQAERRRLAQTLHDHLQQLLYGAKLQFGLLQKQAPRKDAVRQSLSKIDEVLDESIAVSKSLTVELYPPILHSSAGLADLLEWLTSWMQEQHGLSVEFKAEIEGHGLAEDIRVVLFQSVRELLFNVVKHSRVEHARVRLSHGGGNCIQIVVSDDGVGFDPARECAVEDAGGGFGLFSVRERLEWLGGRLEVDSAPGRGTRMTLIAPVAATPARNVSA